MKEPTEHLTMAELLAVPRERLPEWPPIKNDESKVRAALHVLMPEPEWRHDCHEDLEAALGGNRPSSRRSRRCRGSQARTR